MDGLNAGYAALLLEQYLENPSAVPSEWRTLFESAPPEQLVALEPGLARLVACLTAVNGDNGGHVVEAPPPAVHVESRDEQEAEDDLAPAIAGAMRLVNAFRSHGHLAA